MYVLLLTRVFPNYAGAALAEVEFKISWDTTRRIYYREQKEVAQSQGVPFELPQGTEVQRFEVRPGLTHVVKYAGLGTGQVYTEKLATTGGGGGATPSPNLGILVQAAGAYVTSPGAYEASLNVTGIQGLPPYQVAIAPQPGYSGPIDAGVSPSQYYPWRFHNLPAGKFLVSVTDATGAAASTPVEVLVYPGTNPYATELRNDYDGDPQTGTGQRTVWRYNELTTDTTTYTGGGSGDPAGDHQQVAYGVEIDAYLLADGHTWRQVFSDGGPAAPSVPPGVYFTDTDITSTAAAASGLAVDNLIQFDPDTAAEQNGGFVLEMRTTAGPCTFSLPGYPTQTGGPDGLRAALAAGLRHT